MVSSFIRFGWNTLHPGRLLSRQKLVWSMLGIVMILPIVGHGLSDFAQAADDPIPNLYTLRQEHDKELCLEKRSLIDWAAELREKQPKTLKEAFVKIDIMLRAGLDNEVTKTIDQLGALLPDPKDAKNSEKTKEAIKRLANLCFQEFRIPEVTMVIIEKFPDQMDSNMRSTMSQIIYQLQREGWTEGKIDAWIIKLQKKATKDRSFTTDVPTHYHQNRHYQNNFWRIRHEERPGSIWVFIRMENRKQQASRMDLLETLEKEARKDPNDVLRIADYIWAWRQVPRYTQDPKPDPSWIAETAKPKNGFEAGYLGKQLLDAQQWEPARKMLQKSLDLLEKPTNSTSKRSSKMRLYMHTDGQESFKSILQQMLKQCESHLQSSPKPSAPRRVPLTGNLITSSSTACSTALPPHEKDLNALVDDTPVNTKLTAKQIRRKKDEQQILKEEEQSKGDPRYWLRRGNFYMGIPFNEITEEELEKAEQAFKKGLELTGPKPSELDPRRSFELRRQLLHCYLSMLRNANRYEDALDILLKEICTSQDKTIGSMITQHLQHQEIMVALKPDEPIIWDWLAKRKVWEYQECALLNIMARRTKEYVEAIPFSADNEAPEVIYNFVTRIEKMAKEGDLSRMEYCTKVLLGRSPLGIKSNPDRLLPLLKEKFESKKLNDSQRKRIASNLFQAYISSDHFKEAETLIQDPKYDLCNRNTFQSVARIAAKQGDKNVAMRNWRRSANYALKDPQQISLNQTLQRYGLDDEIDKYYEKVKKKLPNFEAP